jgi:hypothetical protein
VSKSTPRPNTAEIIALAAATPTTDIPTASAMLGMGANLGYQLATAGTFPVRVLRMGRKLRVPTADMLVLLGIATTTGEGIAS